MKVVFRNSLNPAWLEAIQALRPQLPQAELVFDPEEAQAQTPLAEVLVGGDFKPEEIEQAPNLKAVIVPFAGVNKLPLKVLAARKIRVANSHGNAATVAERGLALILAFYTRLIKHHNDLARDRWHGFWATQDGSLEDTWEPIREKTCGIIGLGAIGQELSRLLAALGCRNIAWRKHTLKPKPDWVKTISQDLDWVLEQSEIVCLTLALTPDTRGLFDRQRLMGLKGKFLLNLSRADLVDEQGLYESLERGILRGAGLDVWYRYPEKGSAISPPSRFPINKLDNVVLSPHMSGFNPYAARMNIRYTLEQVQSFVQKGELFSEVDPALGY